MKIAGIISGTSLDGIDVAICDVRGQADAVRVHCERFATVPFAETLRARIIAAYPPAPVGALELSALHAAIGEAFGEAVRTIAGETMLDAVASHGVTLAHDGAAHHTLQLGDAFRIRERVGATVLYDFRSADTAAGGTGAPLVPFVDALLFADRAPCVALNLGGIANLTVLPEGIAFDSGPANLPIDTYVTLRSKGTQRYDRDGELARSGTADAPLLARMLDDAYFAQRPPKSTGREEYGAPFIARWQNELDALTFADAVAILTALTVRTVGDAIRNEAPRAELVIVSGGGARNPALLDGLRSTLTGVHVAISDEFGVDADAKEAIAFAVLGYTALCGRAAGLPRVTGATGARVLGAIAPHRLDALLERIRLEDWGGGLRPS
ncbi:MAG: anhydro-N-acetylmuramic acid kinase [Candidatus Eremiobacteraeota bacterium]|nr:anhydro-N-acetylmuramic acid kinase [Candidatus Eremiobacteraeota bacterium]